MGLSLSGNAEIFANLNAEKRITDAVESWAKAVGKFADVGQQLPATMGELASIGKSFPREFRTELGFDLSDDVIRFLPIAYGLIVGTILLVTLIVVCSGNYRKFVDLKVRREEIALLREINRLDHAKAVQTSPKTDAGPRRRKMVEDSPLLNGVVADIGDKMLDAVPSAIVVEKPAKKDKSG